MALYDRHVFVCTNSRAEGHPRGSCAAKGSDAVRERLKSMVAEHGLKGKVRINTAGCLDQCEHGVAVVVYPDEVWYGFVTPADAEKIVESHLLSGAPVCEKVLPGECINTKSCTHRPAPGSAAS